MKSHLAFLAIAWSVCVAHAQQITVYSSGKVEINGSRQLTAYVPLSPNTVNWTVNGIPGGDATYGTVSPGGLYRAPAVVPTSNIVSVRATSTAYADKFHAVDITVCQPFVHLWSVSPKNASPGTVTISANGSNFHAGSVMHLNGMALPTTYVSPTQVRGTATLLPGQVGVKLPVKVVNSGAGGTTSETVTLTIVTPPQIFVAVSPTSATVNLGATRQFTANVTGTSNTSVTWSVNGQPGGNSSIGTIASTGLYSAPYSALPPPATVTIRATSAANNTSFGEATVTIQAPPPPPPPPDVVSVNVSPASATVGAGQSVQLAASVTGTANTAVTWSVNGVMGGNTAFGTVSTTGQYQAPATPPTPATVSVRATSVANATAYANASITITGGGSGGGGAPGSGLANLAAGRFLEQAAYGPTPAELTRVKTIGIEAWLDEQFAMPETPIAVPSDNHGVQAQYLHRLAVAPDQLRQRVAYALSQIIVISINKNNYPNEIVPYLQILSRNAFGNYRTLLGEITISPQMGKYLDLANSNKPSAGSAANENYARELMQLFTIGLYRLNLDGSLQLDAQGNPIRAYEQYTVQQVALALTGWTFAGPGNNNWENFSGPMQSREVNHDTGPKVFVGASLPAGQSTVADMNGTLDWLFTHPNVGPFVATRLIRALVKSNPTPAYISRVATVFNDNGSGIRGDLRAVVRAILTDAEARNDVPTANGGRLKDPIYHVVAFMRALGGSISATNQQAWYFSRMSQTPLAPASVFGFYSPLFRIPRSSHHGPEFQIYGPTEAVLRGNMFWQIISHPGSDFPWEISPWVAMAGNTNALIDAVDQALLYGRMPDALRQSLANAINAQSDNTNKAQTALYLTALSGHYAVQY